MSPSGLSRVKSVSAVLAALALLAGPLAEARHRDGRLKQNAPHFVIPAVPEEFPADTLPGSCKVWVQHGNIFGAAYAKIRTFTPETCLELTATVTAVHADGQFEQRSTGFRVPKKGVWYQATVNFANIIGSEFEVKDFLHRENTWTYSGF